MKRGVNGQPLVPRQEGCLHETCVSPARIEDVDSIVGLGDDTTTAEQPVLPLPGQRAGELPPSGYSGRRGWHRITQEPEPLLEVVATLGVPRPVNVRCSHLELPRSECPSVQLRLQPPSDLESRAQVGDRLLVGEIGESLLARQSLVVDRLLIDLGHSPVMSE